jgi:NAD(P)-dependent dehydrogenase (short-subunit alcohol dehydrogenase family)
MKSLQGKVAVVTGGGGNGIGHCLVNELAKRGAHVAYCDIAGLESTQQSIRPYAVKSYAEIVDISDRAAIKGFVKNVISEFGHADIIINNAGIALGDRSFDQVTEEDFDRITDINYWGVIHTTQQFYPNLLTRPEAAIVNISSSQGIMSLPYLVPYCTTKFAVRGFTDTLRVENKIRGIKNISIHTVHPGAVATNITLNADYQGSSTQKFHENLQAGTSPQRAAEIICDGVLKNKARIFISDGRLHDWAARLLPTQYDKIIRFVMKLKGVEVV